MINLAGCKESDEHIARELRRARIDAVSVPVYGEPKATLAGKLGPFTFTRAWRYWVVEGPMPLAVARELYADPIGVDDVRVAGHCGCPPPEPPWVAYYDAAGERLSHDPDGKEAEGWDRSRRSIGPTSRARTSFRTPPTSPPRRLWSRTILIRRPDFDSSRMQPNASPRRK